MAELQKSLTKIVATGGNDALLAFIAPGGASKKMALNKRVADLVAAQQEIPMPQTKKPEKK